MSLDLDAYFRRIHYVGSRTPTRATLDALCEAHVKAVPFENLDLLLGRGIDLSDEAVDRKLIHEGRGGYCFEPGHAAQSRVHPPQTGWGVDHPAPALPRRTPRGAALDWPS